MARKQPRLHCGVVVIAPLFREKHRGAPTVRLDTDSNVSVCSMMHRHCPAGFLFQRTRKGIVWKGEQHTIIDLETCQSNPKFETVALVAKELNISVDAAIFPDMVNQTVSKTVVDFFAGKSEAEIEKYIALCKQAEAFQKDE